jgi:cation transport protein ChaC
MLSMRVFVYGSLMWQEWASTHSGKRVDLAVLRGYRRSFNKASTRNWGSKAGPCPTLGLEPDESSSCVGTVFEFPEDHRAAVFKLLREREGSDFSFPELDVILPSGVAEKAFVPMGDRSAASYLGKVPLERRAASARTAQGSKGQCADYVGNLRKMLNSLGINDVAVEEFYKVMCGET